MGSNENNDKDELVGTATQSTEESMEGKPKPNENTVKLKQLMRQLSDSPAIMTGNSSSLAKRYTRILAVVALYWFVSITLVFLNKSLLSGATSVDAPLFITCFQCTVTAAACYGILALPPNFGDSLACGQLTISIQTLKKSPTFICGFCSHDHIQQSVLEICWCFILLHRPITYYRV
jgi:hypothetical protein